MRRVSQDDEDEEEEALLEAFRIFDSANKGYIDKDDIVRVVRRLDERLSRREIEVICVWCCWWLLAGHFRLQEMMAMADTNKNGRVDFVEFAAMMRSEEANERARRASVSFEDAPAVYTDGACSKNGRNNAKAGWGVWWGDGHADNDFGAVPGEQTNNRAELLAVIKAINTARSRGHCKLVVRTDSQLLINSMNKWILKWKSNGWRTADGKNVKNQDLLQILDAQLEIFPVHFEHVPGHAGVHGNEMADQLARHAATEVAANRLFIPDLL